jgi:hypothetical protein
MGVLYCIPLSASTRLDSLRSATDIWTTGFVVGARRLDTFLMVENLSQVKFVKVRLLSFWNSSSVLCIRPEPLETDPEVPPDFFFRGLGCTGTGNMGCGTAVRPSSLGRTISTKRFLNLEKKKLMNF